ncbi:hypothetical protein ACE1BS_04885 [Aeromonas jandaei]
MIKIFTLKALLSLLLLLPLSTLTYANLNIGYYGLNGWGEDNTNDVSDHTNIFWVRENDNLDATKALKTIHVLSDILNNHPGKKAVIDVSPVFFNMQTFRLYDDYQNRWDTYIKNIDQSGSDFNTIFGAFYTLDEAYSNGASKGISIEEMTLQLEIVSELVKLSFPDIPLAISYSVGLVPPSVPIPNNYDWIGVDCYGNWNNCPDNNPSIQGKSISEWLSHLKSNINKNQKIILFADAMLNASDISPKAQQALTNRVKNYFAWAQNNPNVTAAIFPFIWQDVLPELIIGTKNLDIFKGDMTKLSRMYLNKQVILPSPQNTSPIIINAGTGCSDNNCIWLLSSNIEDDFRVDIRKTTNTSNNVDWYYRQNRMATSLMEDGTYSITFRITEEDALSELSSNGLRVFLVNPKSGRFTKEVIVKN